MKKVITIYYQPKFKKGYFNRILSLNDFRKVKILLLLIRINHRHKNFFSNLQLNSFNVPYCHHYLIIQ